MLDSGVRRGSDIAKALALGAKAVLTGRATLYGTAVGGEAGAGKAISLIRNELDKTMAYTGCRSVDEMSAGYLLRRPAGQPAARHGDGRGASGESEREALKLSAPTLSRSLPRHVLADLARLGRAQRRLPAARACSSSSIAPPRTTSPSPTTATRSSASSCVIARWSMCPGRSVATTLFGKPASLPMAIAPTGAAGLCWHEGELELAKAAAKAKIPLTLSTASMTRDGEDRAARRSGGRRAAVVPALCLEAARAVAPADPARPPQRLRGADRHGGFPGRRRTANTTRITASACRSIRRCASSLDIMRHPVMGAERAAEILHPDRLSAARELSGGIPEIRCLSGVGSRDAMRADSLDWDDIAKFRDIWPGVADAEGRQPAGGCGEGDRVRGGRHHRVQPRRAEHGQRRRYLDVLPEVAEAVGDRCTVILDSGVRRGSDIAKALALGAKAVLTGRATLYGTAVGGEAGALQGDQPDPQRARQDDGLYRLSHGGRDSARTSSSAIATATA